MFGRTRTARWRPHARGRRWVRSACEGAPRGLWFQPAGHATLDTRGVTASHPTFYVKTPARASAEPDSYFTVSNAAVRSRSGPSAPSPPRGSPQKARPPLAANKGGRARTQDPELRTADPDPKPAPHLHTHSRHLPPRVALRHPSNSPLAGRRVRGARWTRHSSRSGRLWRRPGGCVPSPWLVGALWDSGQAGTPPEDGARPPPPAGHVSQSSQDTPRLPGWSHRHPGVPQLSPPLPRPLRMRRSASGSHSNRLRPASFGPANRRRGGRGQPGRGGVLRVCLSRTCGHCSGTCPRA